MANDDTTALRFARQRGLEALRRTGELLSAIPKPLAILLGVGILLRLALSIVYRPTVLNFYDSSVYAFMADGNLFFDVVRPAGYSMFLGGVHTLSTDVDVTIALQHVLGIVTGLLLYATVRRIGAPVWSATVAAAAVLLSLDQVFFEHTLMAEPLFTLLITVVLYAAVRSLDEPRTLAGRSTSRQAWIVAAGIALGGAAWVRAAGAPMIPFLALWLALAIPGSALERLGRALLGGAAAGAMVLAYFTLHYESDARYFGFSEASGRVLYARTAPFADCNKFEPPAGTSGLCETTPPEERPGPDEYLWADGPANRVFGAMPAGDDKLAAFAREAIIHQPLDYALAVFSDTIRYLAPGFHSRFFVQDYEFFEIRRRDLAREELVGDIVMNYYDEEALRIEEDAAIVLTDLQHLLRVQPVLMLEGLILGAFGVVFARGRVRPGLVLFIGTGLLLIAIPSATATWTARYAIPGNGAFIAAGTVGLWVITRRLIDHRREVGVRPATGQGSEP